MKAEVALGYLKKALGAVGLCFDPQDYVGALDVFDRRSFQKLCSGQQSSP